MDETKLAKELSKLIYIYRTKYKITFRQLAELVSMDASFLNQLEKGYHTTLITNYFKIIKAVKVPSHEINKIINQYLNE